MKIVAQSENINAKTIETFVEYLSTKDSFADNLSVR